MKILLSAYACEPNKGSEPEVGWKWVETLSKLGHEVYIVTRLNNKKNIENYLKKKNLKNINFIYFDFSGIFFKLIKGKKNSFSYLYFILWQVAIYFVVKPYVKKIKFDFIHHVTLVSYRFPSFLCIYKVPFIYGPISGGDTVPFLLRKNFTFINKAKELLRDISNFYVKYSPFLNLVFSKSKIICVNTAETKNFIPKKYHHKIKKILAIGLDKKKIKKKKIKKKNSFNILYAGNLLDIKGINFVFQTFINLKKNNKNVFLTIAGDGKLKNKFFKFCKINKINRDVRFHGSISREKLFSLYKKNDLLFYPSLRDSGGFVILEAMSFYLPSAVLNNGGPGEIINKNCGIKVNLKNKNEYQIINSFTKSITNLITKKNEQIIKSSNAYKRVSNFNWTKKAVNVYGKKILNDKK